MVDVKRPTVSVWPIADGALASLAIHHLFPFRALETIEPSPFEVSDVLPIAIAPCFSPMNQTVAAAQSPSPNQILYWEVTRPLVGSM